MLTISKPLSAGQAKRYHEQDFSNGRENYYTADDTIRGYWQGALAREWGLSRDVQAECFQRLAEGQHPLTGERLVRHRAVCTYTNDEGKSVTTMAHRAGWDATFSAPKSVSLTALVGGDHRVREAHQASVSAALAELEPYVQARRGDHPAQTTGQWIAARFEHDSARPVEGYAAPQLHTHVVIFNVTRTQEGDFRPVQPRELYRTQQYATAVYRSELAARLKQLGYQVERGRSDQPEIRGYSSDYLEASSPRRQQIETHLRTHHQAGAGAAQIAAHQTREPKLEASHESMQARHRALAEAFGHQPDRVVREGHERAVSREEQAPRITVSESVTFAVERNFERESAVGERALLRDALKRSMGDLDVAEVKEEFARRTDRGELVNVSRSSAPDDRAFTTRELLQLETEIIDTMRRGQQGRAPIHEVTTAGIARQHLQLSSEQAGAVALILNSRDQIAALEGVAGAGKTTTLSAVRAYATQAGYDVEGMAPTSRAAQKLAESGMSSGTLQAHLTNAERTPSSRSHLYVLDEASLTSTRQMHALVHTLNPNDRLLLVGDVRQHHAVEAGRPYQQLQAAGMETARLDTIVRQRDPVLRSVVEQLSRGEVGPAVRALNAQGRVQEIPDHDTRIREIAREYLKDPTSTLVVSPDNRSRVEINTAIHQAMQDAGLVDAIEHRFRILVPRQDVTGADRQWAERYVPGDIVRYTRGSDVLHIKPRDYGRIVDVNGDDNRVTVRLQRNGKHIDYDPRRLQGVTLYREEQRSFSTGDRVQITARDRELNVSNRELGTISIAQRGQLKLNLDSGRVLTIRAQRPVHLDHGYAVTSHSSQGQTANRVLVNIDLERASALIDKNMAYVAISRGRHDVRIFTTDAKQLLRSFDSDRQQSHTFGRDIGVSLDISR